MEKSMNKVELKGFAGFGPEVRTLNNGMKMARFTLATSNSYKNRKGEWVRDTTWHNIVMWEKMAEQALEKIRKGMFVSVTGKILYRQYTDKNGVKQNMAEIRAQEFDAVEYVRKQAEEK